MKNEHGYVYVLKLHGANWYVGSTNNIEARICEHWAGQGAQWTQKHTPLGVKEVIEFLAGDPLPLERAKTAEMAMKYGCLFIARTVRANVLGGRAHHDPVPAAARQ